jgi:YggT family protein
MATNLAVVLLNFLAYVIGLYQTVIIAAVIFSWLIGFNVINPSNNFVHALWQGLNAVTEPFLKPIRRALPDMGGLDISPIVLILACVLFQNIISQVLIPAAQGI